jgi:hypothetical protein
VTRRARHRHITTHAPPEILHRHSAQYFRTCLLGSPNPSRESTGTDALRPRGIEIRRRAGAIALRRR